MNTGLSARLSASLKTFSPAERLLLYALSLALTASALSIVGELNAVVSTVIPARGGTLQEGEIGTARFINPVLAVTQADQDVSSVVYSGLLREMPSGELVPDLAQSYSVSSDGLTYSFKLRPGITFQDGSPVTAADVLFTVSRAQDAAIKSPHAADWAGVGVSSPDESTVIFTLSKPYAPFLYDATLGILPKKLWQSVPDSEFAYSPLNAHPVGSGPYEIANISIDATGSTKRYDLAPFDGFALGKPYLSGVSFVFYPNQAGLSQGFKRGEINALADISPSELQSVANDGEFWTVPLPRVFGIFFNQAHNPALADQSARDALNAAIDKEGVIANALGGYAVAIDGPLPADAVAEESAGVRLAQPGPASASATSSADFASSSKAILEAGGWTFDETQDVWKKGKLSLSLTLDTADEPDLVATANAAAGMWRATGIPASVKVYSLSDLNDSVIAPRDYDAILFGEVVGPELDLYAFWHSSQRSDPGLNLALYASAPADSLLSQMRSESDPGKRAALSEQFASLIDKDQPAVFLYSPDFLYILPRSMKGVSLGALTIPAGRFSDISHWYEKTQRVWKAFAPKQ